MHTSQTTTLHPPRNPQHFIPCPQVVAIVGSGGLARCVRSDLRHLSVPQPALQAPARCNLLFRRLLVRLSPLNPNTTAALQLVHPWPRRYLALSSGAIFLTAGFVGAQVMSVMWRARDVCVA